MYFQYIAVSSVTVTKTMIYVVVTLLYCEHAISCKLSISCLSTVTVTVTRMRVVTKAKRRNVAPPVRVGSLSVISSSSLGVRQCA